MIEVSNLTKRYAGRTAVDDISFTVARGEIVGLLGPNGAGKSTTMRVLSGFMPATSGTVRVAGFDVFHDADETRRRIGYMPENNPLHPEMRVREYLKFRARLKGLGWKKSRERVTTVMEQCGLADVGRRIIGQLSKGYKQRVGLADALVHEPELIILDEPTIGLDPQQIRSVRALIKSLAGSHTVLISTHILPEVEMMCGRVLIMLDGRVLADATAPGVGSYFVGQRIRVWVAAGERMSYVIPDHLVVNRFGLSYVRRREPDGATIDVPVQLGRDTPEPGMTDGVEILSGLATGDVLVVPASAASDAR